jgi:hypothetical protein
MKKITRAGAEKARKHRPTVRDPVMGLPMSPTLRRAALRWAENQSDKPSLPEAVRRLVALGLTVTQRHSQAHPARARVANEAAAMQLDRLADVSATSDEQADRKSQLLRGPEEFRKARVDGGRES